MADIQDPPVKGKSNRWKWMALAVVLLTGAAFLFGYIPQRSQATRLETELTSVRQNQQKLLWQQRQSQMRDDMNHAYLEITRNNYGVASQYSTEAFNSIRALLQEATDAGEKAALQKIDDRRDEITALLAKADPAVKEKVGEILDEINRSMVPHAASSSGISCDVPPRIARTAPAQT